MTPTTPADLDAEPVLAPVAPVETSARPGRTVGRVLVTFLTWSFAAASLGQPLAWLLSRRFWVADLFCHFREPGLVLTLLSVSFVARRSRRLAVAFAVLGALQVWPLLQFSGSNPVLPDAASNERLRILCANVLFDNASPAALADVIRKERPDVVAIVEYNPDCHEALRSVAEDYPYRFERPIGPNGLALWFRLPPVSLGNPTRPVADRHDILHATFRFAGVLRHLWVVHPTSPLWRVLEPGHPEFEAIAREIAATEGSRIVVGDMNSTDASGLFRDFLATTRLRDSRLGFGRQATWPSPFPYRIAIDHVFLTDDLAVVDRRLGENVGSDHLPVLIDLAPAARSAERDASQPSQSTAPTSPTRRASVSSNRGPLNLARSARWR